MSDDAQQPQRGSTSTGHGRRTTAPSNSGRSRSTRACDTCKRKRQRCDGLDPCGGCIGTYSIPQLKRGPKRETAADKSNSNSVGTNLVQRLHQSSPGEDLHSRVRNMETILSTILQTSNLIAKSEQLEPTASSCEWNESSDGEMDGSERSGKRARISEIQEDEFLESITEAGRTPATNSDIDHLIEILNSAESPESMANILELIDKSQFISDTSMVDNFARRGSLDKTEKGFRGIALSLQRKMRRSSVLPSGTAEKNLTTSPAQSPESEENVSTSVGDGGRYTVVEDMASDAILFFGSTSTTTSSAWRQSPRFAGGVMNISLSFEANPPSMRVQSGDYSPPCSTELVLYLVGLYFQNVHPYFPMVNKARFFQQWKQRKRTDHFNLLLNSMCALMSQHMRNLSAWGVSNHIELHMAFFERARVLLGQQFDWPHINNVQALLLLCIVGQGTNINATSYHYIGIAYRLAVELGMHRNLDNLRHPSLDPELLETMRTTWFCLYVLDRYTSIVEGRPLAISDDEWDTPFPTSTTAEITNLRHHVGLCEIFGRISNFVNRPNRAGPTSKPSVFSYLTISASHSSQRQSIEDMKRCLASWHAGLADGLGQRPSSGSPWNFHHHMYAMYHTASVLLRRLDVTRFDQSCISNAVEISKVLESLPKQDDASLEKGSCYFVLPVIVYSALTASTLFLDVVLAGQVSLKRKLKPAKPPALTGKITPDTSRQASKYLRRSLTAFDRLKTTSLFANYYGQLVVEILKSDGIILPEEQLDPSPSPPAEVAVPVNNAASTLFNFFSSTGDLSQFSSPGSGANAPPSNISITSRIANSMANWNEFLHFSPKPGPSQLDTADTRQPPAQGHPPPPTSSLLSAATSMWGRFSLTGTAPMVGGHSTAQLERPISPLATNILTAAETSNAESGSMSTTASTAMTARPNSPYNDLFSDFINSSSDAWSDISLAGLGRRTPGFGYSPEEVVERTNEYKQEH